MLPRSPIVLGLVCAASAGALAESRVYDLNVPAGEPLSLEVRLDVAHAGELVIDAEWTGPRVLAFRLDPPPSGGSESVRRSGPSPQRLMARIGSESGTVDARPWTLSIRGLAGPEGGAGTLRIELPSAAPDPPPAPAPVAAPPPAPAMRLEVEPVPDGLPAEWVGWVRAARHFRAALDTRDAADSCAWQAGFADYVEQRWRAQVATGALPSSSERAVLERLAAAVRAVATLDRSDDPVIAGPPPDDPELARVWLGLRRERLKPIEAQLDRLIEDLRRIDEPALAGPWPLRFASCLTATERHFDERVRLGAGRAANRELAEAQWGPMLEATGLLEALVALAPPAVTN